MVFKQNNYSFSDIKQTIKRTFSIIENNREVIKIQIKQYVT